MIVILMGFWEKSQIISQRLSYLVTTPNEFVLISYFFVELKGLYRNSVVETLEYVCLEALTIKLGDSIYNTSVVMSCLPDNNNSLIGNIFVKGVQDKSTYFALGIF